MAGVNIKELIKEELHLVQDVVELESMEAEKRTDFLTKAHELYENKVLQQILGHAIDQQKQLTIGGAETEKQLWAGRANIAGVVMIQDELARLNVLWEADREPEEFEKHSII